MVRAASRRHRRGHAIVTRVQIQAERYWRSDCLQCGRELLFPMFGDGAPTKEQVDNTRTFCTRACFLLWKDDHPEEGVTWDGT
jgi:hypothetical protein